MASRHFEQRRGDCFRFGSELRERLLRGYMAKYRYTDRPFLKQVVDDLIEEELGARLREEVLPLDRYAQSELVRNRIVVSVNSRTAEIPRVKHAGGVAYAGKWHEVIHVVLHLKPGSGAEEQQPLPLFEEVQPRIIVCRLVDWRRHENPDWEFTAENAGLAAAIAPADLLRCDSFLELLERARRGGDLGRYAWHLLYDTANRIGVNEPALLRYLTYRGVCRADAETGVNTIVADPQLFEGLAWLETETSLAKPAKQATLERTGTGP